MNVFSVSIETYFLNFKVPGENNICVFTQGLFCVLRDLGSKCSSAINSLCTIGQIKTISQFFICTLRISDYLCLPHNKWHNLCKAYKSTIRQINVI